MSQVGTADQGQDTTSPDLISDVDVKMAADGFPELRWLWERFKRTGDDLSNIDGAAVAERRDKHMASFLSRPAGAAGFFAVVGSLMYIVLDVVLDFPKQTVVDLLMLVLFAGLLAYAAGFLLTVVRRCFVSSWKDLAATDLALMLRTDSFRTWFRSTSRYRELAKRLGELGVSSTWDDPDYVTGYKSETGEIVKVELLSRAELIQQALRDVLGAKVDRKFQPGRFYSHLKRGKKSVSAFVGKHKDQLAQARQGSLTPEDAIAMFTELRQELEPDSAGDQHLANVIESIGQGDTIPPGVVKVLIWPRDPWVDLTHSRDFFSSASLRDDTFMDSIERRTKGALGPFGYMHNPSISALDFCTSKGRGVRARLALVQIKGPNGVAKTALFVDAVEGRITVKPKLIRTAIEDYARALKVDCVLYHLFPLNRVPQHFVQHLVGTGNQAVEVDLEYLDSTTKEYLDAFGMPMEPFEYAFPKGKVIGLPVAIAGDVPESLEPVGKGKRMWYSVRSKFPLWALVLSSFACLLWIVHHMFPAWLIPTAVILAIVLLYERLISPRFRRKLDVEEGGSGND